MYCPKCGATNADAAATCAQCGAPIKEIPNYLAQSILVTLLCCLPLGIPAIVYAASVNGKALAGDLPGAMEASRKARLWCWWSFGFGLVYVLVFLVGMLAAILIPAVSKATTSAGMVKTVSNGENIYQAAFAGQMDAVMLGNDAAGWPKTGEYRTSTEYFIHLVTSGVLNVSYDFFAAPGVPPAKTSDPRKFTAENNAWRLVLGLDKAGEGTPYLFTKNYDPTRLPGENEPIGLTDSPPFGRQGMVVVLKGGSAFTLKGNQLKSDFFNPAGTPPPGIDVTIVGP